MSVVVKNEYPRPQFVRNSWQNLNGKWQFAFDDDDLGIKEKWYQENIKLGQYIQVPFVYQSKLSMVNDLDIHDVIWYKKKVKLKEHENQKEVILHFGAVDYQAQVYVNEHLVIEHEGGCTPFSVNITHYLKEGEQDITVRAYDPHEDEFIPRGKQFWKEQTKGIWYTNSTGIWQTVWLECISGKHIVDVKYCSLYDEGKVNIRCRGSKVGERDKLYYEISCKGKSIADGSLSWRAEVLDFSIDIIQAKIFHTNVHEEGLSWTPETPTLLDVKLMLKNEQDEVCDEINSYFGFRKVHIENGMVYLNNKPYYQKLVLDQGYWPEGLMTAPDDEALIRDIENAKEMGFNGCRKHQKVEDPRFLYWADRLGYIVWGENASTVMYNDKAVKRIIDDWAQIVDRDYNHPCILVWVPINESWGVPHIHNDKKQQHFAETMYHYLHAIDNTRLVVSNDGWEMTTTDICAIHNYKHGEKKEAQVYQEYREILATKERLISHPSTCRSIYANGYFHKGEPIMLTEFGGIGLCVSAESGWGYTSVSSEEEFIEEYGRIIEAVYASKGLWGFCYTQLADVEQEINGLLTYDRKPKCDLGKIREINNRYHVSRIIC